MRIFTLLGFIVLLGACSGSLTHYTVDNPYDITSAIGRRPLHGRLISPGVVDVRVNERHLGQPVKDSAGRVVGYVTGSIECREHYKGCATYKR